MPAAHTNFKGSTAEIPKEGEALEQKTHTKRTHGGVPEVELCGNRSIVITGRCVITLYSAEEMRVQCGGLTVRVSGDGLELCTLDEAELSIEGLITEVGFVTEEG